MAAEKSTSSSATSGSEQDELTYFNFRGRAETIRLLYILGDKTYTDTRIEFGSQEWADMKPGMPYGQLPILKRGSVVIPQSMAIARLIAREVGVAGKDEVERTLADSVVDAIEEFGNLGTDIFVFEQDEAKKAERGAVFMEKVLPVALENLNKIIENNAANSNYFVGDKMLWCDVHFYAVADRFIKSDADTLKKYPLLATLYEKVAAHPKIATWIENRPETVM